MLQIEHARHHTCVHSILTQGKEQMAVRWIWGLHVLIAAVEVYAEN